ncbi:MAG: DUF1592 domain-containing protein, partial [Planctomycetota bacterium]
SYFNPAAGSLPAELTVRAREYGGKYPVLLPTAGLPADARAEHGFSNRGDAQDFSDVLLGQYLDLAAAVANHPDLFSEAARLRDLAPDVSKSAKKRQPRRTPTKPRQTASFTAEFAPNDNVARTAAVSTFTLEAFRQEVAAAQAEGRGGVFSGEQTLNTHVPGKGGVLTLTAASGGRAVGLNPSEDLWSAVFSSGRATGGKALLTNKVKGTRSFLIAFQGVGGEDAGVRAVGLCLLSRRGESGAVHVTADYTDGSSGEIAVTLAEGAGADNVFVSFSAPERRRIRRLRIDGGAYSGDHVLLDDLALLTDPPRAAALVGVEPPAEAEPPKPEPPPVPTADLGGTPRDRVARFLRRAFRRPVGEAETDLYFRLYEQAEDEETGARQVVRAVLSSPSFLYVNPAVAAADAGAADGPMRPLSDHELANRLAYFLWSTMPDEELLALAAAGRLSDPDILEAQARRMLKDPRVRELSENFYVEWLRLREVWSARPDPRAFRAYYSGASGKNTLADDMVTEALLLFEMTLAEDRPVLDLVGSDVTYVNQRLARLYGLDPDQGEDGGTISGDLNDQEFRRVRSADGRRGGALTTGAVLTLTSFPHRTSPIRRGAWVLEAVFNRPPAPPKVVVTDIDEQEHAGTLTLRQKVEAHRADPSCAVCHDRIDPPGFVLENYDAIGRWRTEDRTEDGAEPVEPGGTLPGLGTFDDVAGFKALLRQDRTRFARGFTERLLSYALARKLEYHDLAPVERILQNADPGDFRLSDLVAGIVRSRPFRHADRSEFQPAGTDR